MQDQEFLNIVMSVSFSILNLKNCQENQMLLTEKNQR